MDEANMEADGGLQERQAKNEKPWKAYPPETYRNTIAELVHFSSKTVNSNAALAGVRLASDDALDAPYVSARTLMARGVSLSLDYGKGGAAVAGICKQVNAVVRGNPFAEAASSEERRAIEDAMTRPQALAAIAAGMEQAAIARAGGVTALGIGEMGIGNTSTSAAVLAVLTGADIETVTGRGGGLTDRAFARKKDVLRTSVGRRPIRRDDVVDVLCAVGGLDIAAMTGAFLGCAHEGIPAAVDGFISVTAALCAVALCPAVRDYLFLSHDSYEVGYRLAAERLGLEPCLHLGMRLGEGSGCPLLFRVMEGACGVMSGMATFAEAAIHDGYLDEIRAQDSFTVDRP